MDVIHQKTHKMYMTEDEESLVRQRERGKLPGSSRTFVIREDWDMPKSRQAQNMSDDACASIQVGQAL
jgi:hypothetical protein